MPLYCTKQGMIDRFGQNELIQLTDRSVPPSDIIDDTVLNQALADADSVINGYLSARYTLPLANIPTSLARYAADIARYFLYDDDATERVEKAYDKAISFLKDVSKGVASVGVDQAGGKPAESNQAEMVSGGRVFSRENTSGSF